MGSEILIIIIILILSVVVHEVSHGYAAFALGDPTADLAGRLTLNPLKHIDPVGSVIVPAILVLTSAGFVFGWAKPVPYNPYNLRKGKWGEALVAFAGPAVNILIALVFGLIIRFSEEIGITSAVVLQLIAITAYINVLLAVFNLIPIPPLDGAKVLSAMLPYRYAQVFDRFQEWMMRFGMLAMFGFIIVFVLVFSGPFFAFVEILFDVVAGTPLQALL